MAADQVALGIDVGGTKTNATVLDSSGRFLVDRMVEVPSRVLDGPDAALTAIRTVADTVLELVGHALADVSVIGLDTPGPASASGVIASRGAINFSDEAWWGYDLRGELEHRMGLPVAYCNDGNAAALYAHEMHFGSLAQDRSSVSAIVGTGLGGGVIVEGHIVAGARGLAGELGHIHVPLDGILGSGQPTPRCNCGFEGDVESVASLSGIKNNLLPYWLTRYPDHPLATMPIDDAAKAVRSYGEQGDELARAVFDQQAAVIGRLFSTIANVTDPDAFFVGGGVTEADPAFTEWFIGRVNDNITSMKGVDRASDAVVVSDLDMAGARGAAIHALRTHH